MVEMACFTTRRFNYYYSIIHQKKVTDLSKLQVSPVNQGVEMGDQPAIPDWAMESIFSPNLSAMKLAVGKVKAKIKKVVKWRAIEYHFAGGSGLPSLLEGSRNLFPIYNAKFGKKRRSGGAYLPYNVFLHFSVVHGKLLAIAINDSYQWYIPVCWSGESCNDENYGIWNSKLVCGSCLGLIEQGLQDLKVADGSKNWSLPWKPMTPAERRDAWDEYLREEEKDFSKDQIIGNYVSQGLVACLNKQLKRGTFHISNLTYHQNMALQADLTMRTFSYRLIDLSFCPLRQCVLYKAPDMDDWSAVCSSSGCFTPAIPSTNFQKCKLHGTERDKLGYIFAKLCELGEVSNWQNFNKQCLTVVIGKIREHGSRMHFPGFQVQLAEDGETFFIGDVGRPLYALCQRFGESKDCEGLCKGEFCGACEKIGMSWKVGLAKSTTDEDVTWYSSVIVESRDENFVRTQRRWKKALSQINAPTADFHMIWESDAKICSLKEAESWRLAAIIALLVEAHHYGKDVNIRNSYVSIRSDENCWVFANAILQPRGISLEVDLDAQEMLPTEDRWFDIVSTDDPINAQGAAPLPPSDRFSMTDTVYEIYHTKTPKCYIGAREGSRLGNVEPTHHSALHGPGDPTSAAEIPNDGNRHSRTVLVVNRSVSWLYPCETLGFLVWNCATVMCKAYKRYLVNHKSSSFAFRCATWFTEMNRLMWAWHKTGIKIVVVDKSEKRLLDM